VIRVGPAGWAYPDSPGRVYPAGAPKRFDPLAYLAHFFDTIEINASFYAPPAPRTCRSWARRVDANPAFRFTAKLWQRFTHGVKTFGRAAAPPPGAFEPWTRAEVAAVGEGLEALREEGRLGAVLAQFPWSFRAGPESRERLARLAEAFAGWPLVVELRHGSWAQREHALFLRQHGLGFCNLDQPVIGESLGPTAGATSGVGYVRLHGRRYDTWFEHGDDVAARYDYLYTAEELEPWIERIRRVASAEAVSDVYVITNNHYEGKGPANALMIRAMLEDRQVTAPPVLFETYREVLAPFAEPA
jgi:uncharacterized protein YecE (DUF72 family)